MMSYLKSMKYLFELFTYHHSAIHFNGIQFGYNLAQHVFRQGSIAEVIGELDCTGICEGPFDVFNHLPGFECILHGFHADDQISVASDRP